MADELFFGLLYTQDSSERFTKRGYTIDEADFEEATKAQFRFVGIINTSTLELVRVGSYFENRQELARSKVIAAYQAMKG